jgi:beta-glucosidase
MWGCWLLLRWQGATIGDFGAINRLYGALDVATDAADAISQYINAGGNTEGYDIATYEKIIVELVTNATVTCPRVSMETLDARVGDVLRVKLRFGLIDSPKT